MTDLQDLKAIAERCKAHQPLRFMQSYGALYIRNDNGIVFDVHQNRSFPDFMAQNKDYADLVLAANPAAVLELIASEEEASALCDTHFGLLREVALAVRGPEEPLKRHGFADLPSRVKTVVSELEKLKAENEALHAKIDRLLAHCPDGECATCGEIICPHGGAMHFHHDGCPSCAEHEAMSEEAGHD